MPAPESLDTIKIKHSNKRKASTTFRFPPSTSLLIKWSGSGIPHRPAEDSCNWILASNCQSEYVHFCGETAPCYRASSDDTGAVKGECRETFVFPKLLKQVKIKLLSAFCWRSTLSRHFASDSGSSLNWKLVVGYFPMTDAVARGVSVKLSDCLPTEYRCAGIPAELASDLSPYGPSRHSHLCWLSIILLAAHLASCTWTPGNARELVVATADPVLFFVLFQNHTWAAKAYFSVSSSFSRSLTTIGHMYRLTPEISNKMGSCVSSSCPHGPNRLSITPQTWLVMNWEVLTANLVSCPLHPLFVVHPWSECPAWSLCPRRGMVNRLMLRFNDDGFPRFPLDTVFNAWW